VIFFIKAQKVLEIGDMLIEQNMINGSVYERQIPINSCDFIVVYHSDECLIKNLHSAKINNNLTIISEEALNIYNEIGFNIDTEDENDFYFKALVYRNEKLASHISRYLDMAGFEKEIKSNIIYSSMNGLFVSEFIEKIVISLNSRN
jgi:hypothetical protein